MPKMDGYEATRRIRSGAAGVLDPEVRIIAMTGYYTAGNVQRILSAGAEACLPKPTPTDELLEAIGLSTGVLASV